MELINQFFGVNQNKSQSKIIYYYQTFSSLKKLSSLKLSNTYVYVSSLHFGKDDEGNRYLHLNDDNPDHQSSLWDDVKLASEKGVNILVMLGGAGGAYTSFFENEESFNAYYKLLYLFLKKYPFIKGIDLDVEENVDILYIIRLIAKLDRDFGQDFIISMAPVVGAMETDYPGMGGFNYKTLYNTMEGRRINWFNVQCYGDYTHEIYKNIINNGYPPDKIVFGMLGDNYDSNSFKIVLDEITKIKNIYHNMSGVMIWEYGDTKIDPIEWGSDLSKILNN